MIRMFLGGARSGKSVVAERVAAELAPPVSYLATAVIPDGDRGLAARVAAHRRRRPAAWRTVETGADLVGAVTASRGTVLIDGLGTWVASAEAFTVDVDGLCVALRAHDGDVVIVSDEVGLGVHPSTATGREFRDALGLLNQAVADASEDAWLVVAGRILRLDRW